MAYNLTWLQLFNRAMRRAHLPEMVGSTAAVEQQLLLQHLVQDAYNEVNSLGEWPWLEAVETLSILASPLELTTADVDAGEYRVDGISLTDAQRDAYVNGFASLYQSGTFETEPAFFFVRSGHIIADGSPADDYIEVVPVPMNSTSTTATINLYQDAVALPSDFSRPISAEGFLTNYIRCQPVDYHELVRRRIMEGRSVTLQDEPRCYAIYGEVITWDGEHEGTYGGHDYEGRRLLHVYPWPDDAQHIKIHYIKRPVQMSLTSDVVQMPAKAIESVLSLALADYFHCPGVDDQNNPKGEMMFQEAIKEIRRLVTDYEKSSNRPIITPAEIDRSIYEARSTYRG